MANGNLLRGLSPYIKSTADLVTQYLMQGKAVDKYPQSAEAYKQLTSGELLEPQVTADLIYQLDPNALTKLRYWQSEQEVGKKLTPEYLAGEEKTRELMRRSVSEGITSDLMLEAAEIPMELQSKLFAFQRSLDKDAGTSELYKSMVRGYVPKGSQSFDDPNFWEAYSQLPLNEQSAIRSAFGLDKEPALKGWSGREEDIKVIEVEGKKKYMTRNFDGTWSRPVSVGSNEGFWEGLSKTFESINQQLAYLRTNPSEETNRKVQKNIDFFEENVWSLMPDKEDVQKILIDATDTFVEQNPKVQRQKQRIKTEEGKVKLSFLPLPEMEKLTPEQYTDYVMGLTEAVTKYYVDKGFKGADDEEEQRVLEGLFNLIQLRTGFNVKQHTDLFNMVMEKVREE